MTVFCQAGQISVPGGYRAVVAYLEETLREVAAPTVGFVFHPKVWVISYASGLRRRAGLSRVVPQPQPHV